MTEDRKELPSETLQALDHLRHICDFAYRMGFHELGYNPVETLRAELAQRAQAEPVAWMCMGSVYLYLRDAENAQKYNNGNYPIAPLYTSPQSPSHDRLAQCQSDCHRLDTPDRVLFYENDFYPLSNFSAFKLRWKSRTFDTSEAAYHWEKFYLGAVSDGVYVRDAIMGAKSAHDAFKLAEQFKSLRRPDWDDVKVSIMRDILRSKAEQHEYVRRKLLATGNRELIEDSWRDDFWGWGPNRDGKNMLGKLWMGIRAELAAAPDKAKR